MASRADRAINMALRVTGIGEVERDFKRVGDAGEKSFAQVEKSANGAAREVSEYHARLKRVALAAREAFANIPEANKGTAAQVTRNRQDFVLGAVQQEKVNILDGRAESTANFLRMAGQATDQVNALDVATGGLNARMALLTAGGLAAGAMFAGLVQGALASLEAFEEHERAIDAFEAELSLAGNASNATADQIQEMAKSVVDATLQTEKAALKGAAALARVPNITKDVMEQALEATARYADAMGEDLPSALEKKTIPVLQALADRDMKALLKATEDLERGLDVTILQLAEAGKTAEAQQALFKGLNDAAGDGPSGLATATDRLSKAWDRLKQSMGEDLSAPVALGLNKVADLLDWIRDKAADTGISIRESMGNALSSMSPLFGMLIKGIPSAAPAAPSPRATGWAGPGAFVDRYTSSQAARIRKDFETRYDPPSARRGGGGGRGGKSDAEREAERLKREAEQARTAADRIAEANQDVVASYNQRVVDIEATVGLEGAALKAVERQQAIEAAARRINIEELAKEVEARRLAAQAAGQQFDEIKATEEAAEAVGRKADAVRQLAAREWDAQEATAAWNKRQAEAKAILEATRTPLEDIASEIERAVKALQAGDISGDTFNRRMEQLAGNMADVASETDKAAQAWEGFGQDVSGVLSDIVFNGGSAMDVLRGLLGMAAERLFEANIGNPIADWIDGLTGNNREKNVATARDALPFAADALEGLAGTTDAARAAMGSLVPLTGEFGGALGAVIAQMAGMSLGGGGGGGGLLGTILKLGGSAIGGGGFDAGALTASANSAIDAGIASFKIPGYASGTERVPFDRDFYVGENGRERMRYTRDGGLRVISGERTRRMASEGGGAMIVHNTINIPERADPKRTASQVARGMQVAQAKAGRKRLAGA